MTRFGRCIHCPLMADCKKSLFNAFSNRHSPLLSDVAGYQFADLDGRAFTAKTDFCKTINLYFSISLELSQAALAPAFLMQNTHKIAASIALDEELLGSGPAAAVMRPLPGLPMGDLGAAGEPFAQCLAAAGKGQRFGQPGLELPDGLAGPGTGAAEIHRHRDHSQALLGEEVAGAGHVEGGGDEQD